MNTPAQTKYKVLLIGDSCTDIYQYGTVDRLSPEAPVPIFEYTDGEIRDGMSGNVKANLEKLGCEVIHFHGNLSKKTRLIDERSKQQLLRIDEDSHSLGVDVSKIKDLNVDCIVISDYNKGFVTYEAVEHLRKVYSGPIFIDTKKTDVYRFEGCFVKINELENSRLTSACSNLIVTMGKQGAVLGGHIYPAPEVEVSDVCGAGDTFLAALAFEYLNTNDIKCAIKFAVKASAVTVQHVGVYAPELEEIT